MRLNQIIFYICLLISCLTAYFYFSYTQKKYNLITSFASCKDAGYPVTTTYPETCTMPGKTFTNPLQKKVETTLSKKEGINLSELSFLYNGTQLTIGSPGTSSSLYYYAPVSYVGTFNDDIHEDTLFIGYSTTTKKSFYVILALGSYTQGLIGSNALFLGESAPVSIVATGTEKNNFSVLFSCKDRIGACYKTFRIDNDILIEHP